MASPSSCADGATQQTSTTATAADGESVENIPRRLMRVKVLYTFDDQNKSNCLARLPNALDIPTVSLDETTQVGVIELKTCIQAIVSASPELVAKLGHDFTVYAYDYSEYETPLVGQGMLSWILASASATPNAPAEQSQTMVTGRVCKNLLGLFSNGIKETLEVKLKLVPVPTCLQREYVENLERYHSLSAMVPEGVQDFNAWAEFLKTNPAIHQLAQPTAMQSMTGYQRGGVESFHEMLTRPSPTGDLTRFDSFEDQRRMSAWTDDTRASSPAVSTASFYQYPYAQGSRPASRTSFYSESPAMSQQVPAVANTGQDEQEEGPPKKRARVTKAKRPRKAAMVLNNDSLRVTASTASSVRLLKPIGTVANSAISAEQVPRAPTPRPENLGMPLNRGPLRPPAPSLLRHASTDEGRPYISPYESSIFSDNAIETVEDERSICPGDTPQNMPSSPPVMAARTASSCPSSPELPSLSLPNDSGFVSDLSVRRDDEVLATSSRPWDGSDLPTASDRQRPAYHDAFSLPWTEETPGPREMLPQTYIPDYQAPLKKALQSLSETSRKDMPNAVPLISHTSTDQGSLKTWPGPEPPACYVNSGLAASNNGKKENSEPTVFKAPLPLKDAVSVGQPMREFVRESDSQRQSTSGYSNKSFPTASYVGINASHSGSPYGVLQPGVPTVPKARALHRSHTWSGEPMSDGPQSNSRQPRSGGRAKRKPQTEINREKLDRAIVSGEMPEFCNNCGQIDTPAWRRAYMRVETGLPEGIELSSKGTAIAAFDIIEPEEASEDGPKYRVFKYNLTEEEAESDTFEMLTLCNPCGLWLTKKNSMRPYHIWAKQTADKLPLEKSFVENFAESNTEASKEKPKRKRDYKKEKQLREQRKRAKLEQDLNMSDANMPFSEPIMPDPRDESEVPRSLDGTDEAEDPFSLTKRSASFQVGEGSQLDEDTAQAALFRAIQSSPVGLRGSRDSPINLENDLTPKPTRRTLFPSPRQLGEVKSLTDKRTLHSPTTTSRSAEPLAPFPTGGVEEVDKENCPPAGSGEDDSLTHLFVDAISQKTTPTKERPLFEDLLKTPTPGSRRRNLLTPKRGTVGRTTPSRATRTPRTTGRAPTVAPETPFTRQLNQLLSEMPSSPSLAIDFSAFPTFNTPGRNHGAPFSFLSEDFLSSDLPIPSSPPGGLGFSVFEDPNTSTVGLWSGASIFETSDAIITDVPGEDSQEHGQHTINSDATVSRISEISLNFAAMIDEVVGNGSKEAEEQTQRSGGAGKTPEEQVATSETPANTHEDGNNAVKRLLPSLKGPEKPGARPESQAKGPGPLLESSLNSAEVAQATVKGSAETSEVYNKDREVSTTTKERTASSTARVANDSARNSEENIKTSQDLDRTVAVPA